MPEQENKNQEAEVARVLGPDMRKAIRFSLKTHEVYQKQKRKGTDIPYITHPLIVGLLLARAGAPRASVLGGILHDTIEDSPAEKKVTHQMLAERFGQEVADIVADVTEQDKSLSWQERKTKALEHIKEMAAGALWVKTADVICNVSDILDDHKREGESIFARFNAPREDLLADRLKVLSALLQRWEALGFKDADNPLIVDLEDLRNRVEELSRA